MKDSTIIGITAAAAAAAAFVFSPTVAVSAIILPFLYAGGKKIISVSKETKRTSITPTSSIITKNTSKKRDSSSSKTDQSAGASKSRKEKASKQEKQQTSQLSESPQENKKKKAEPVSAVKVGKAASEPTRHLENACTVITLPSMATQSAKQQAPIAMQLSEEDALKQQIEEKWSEVLDYAKQHATKQGMHTGVKWLEDSFNEYLSLTDSTPGYGMGGQPGSMHNREVLAGKILLELGNHVGGQHAITDEQEARLRESLAFIVDRNGQQKQLKR